MHRDCLHGRSVCSPDAHGGGGAGGGDLASIIESRIDRRTFQQHHWEGSFFDYLSLAQQRPGVARNAYQRLYDAILSYGFEKYRVFKRDCVRYHFFSDPIDHGADAIYGLVSL